MPSAITTQPRGAPRLVPAAAQLQPPPPPAVPVAQTSRVWQVPTAHVPPAPQGPTTFDTKQGPESGGRFPPQSRCSMHCMTVVQAVPPVHIALALHSGLGEHRGPACEELGVEPGGQDAGGGPTASARAPSVRAIDESASPAVSASESHGRGWATEPPSVVRGQRASVATLTRR